MRQLWNLTLTELRRFRGPLPMLSAIFLVLVPLLYGAIYLWSNWDPYGRLDRLQVAVVDPAHQVVQQAGVQHVLDRLPRRRASTLQRPERPRHSLVVRRHRHSLYSLESGTPPTQTI